MKKFQLSLLILFAFTYTLSAQLPSAWHSRGIGGGGALFSPSINPANHNELYMGCDMSELFHSTDMGLNWNEVNFLQLQGGHDAFVQFTSNQQVRFCVDYSTIDGNDCIRPMKSTDGGISWSVLNGNPYPL
ncbi:MAG: hypothetical protein NTW31_02345, partial [Bacteroidetes bacterium]|nr:hypothetical protein [Bacteroidota bacterium]